MIQQVFAGLILASALACFSTAQSQRHRTPPFRVDPYTKNDPAQMAKAGYVSYGPFEFGQRGDKPVTTADIDTFFQGERRLLWVETEHFKIGLELDAWPVPTERTARTRIRQEIEQLEARTQWKRLNPRTRRLDPWLRLHLYAQRFERLYDEFLELVGRADEDFPRDRGTLVDTEYRGEGPFLGQPGKYIVLVFGGQEDYLTYLRTYTGRNSEDEQRWNYKKVGSLAFITSTESGEGRNSNDTALYCSLAFNLTHMFINGYEHYSYNVPVWINEGVAHWIQRRIAPKWNSFSRGEGAAKISKKQWRWDLETHKIIAAGDYAPFVEASKWRTYADIAFDDHIALWSRWDFLMSKGKERFAKFLGQIKGRTEAGAASDKALLEAVRAALQDAYGISSLSFDEQWTDWVKKNYARR